MRLRWHGRRLVLLLVALAAAPTLLAQGHPARVEGAITDSASERPAVGAIVYLTRLSPQPGDFRSTVTDDRGRFHFDTLVAGHYSISFATAYLDSLGIAMPAREIVLADGETQRVDLSTPSGATLRAAACPDVELPHGKGAVLGTVTDADTDRPLTTARVAVTWTDLSADPKTARPIITQRGGDVAVDSLGRYRLCGVPTGTYLLLQVQDSSRVGSAITLNVGDEGGVMVRDLSLSAESARSVASLDSAAVAASRDGAVTPPPLLTGTATLTGVVRDASGHPLSNAQVRISDAAGTTRSDSSGRFSLGSQPAGSQVVEARHVGYLLGRTPVDLRSGRTTDVGVTLTRIVSLDSIRVVARRDPYSEFERRRKEGFGRFLDEAAIEHQHAFEASDLLRPVLGFRVEGNGDSAKVFSTHGAFEGSGRGRCKVNVVIDGVFEHQDINLVDPATIAAIEAYPGPEGAPIQYDRACGVIVIWQKRAHGPSR